MMFRVHAVKKETGEVAEPLSFSDTAIREIHLSFKWSSIKGKCNPEINYLEKIEKVIIIS